MPTNASTRALRRLAADVGFVLAPAGLDFVVPGTTWWLYATGADPFGAGTPRGLRVRALDDRIAFDVGSLRANRIVLRTLDAVWRARLARAGVDAPRPTVRRAVAAQLAELAGSLRDDLPLRALTLRAAGIFEALRLVPAYHPRGAPTPGYLPDMLANGLCVLLVERARSAARARPSTVLGAE